MKSVFTPRLTVIRTGMPLRIPEQKSGPKSGPAIPANEMPGQFRVRGKQDDVSAGFSVFSASGPDVPFQGPAADGCRTYGGPAVPTAEDGTGPADVSAAGFPVGGFPTAFSALPRTGAEVTRIRIPPRFRYGMHICPPRNAVRVLFLRMRTVTGNATGMPLRPVFSAGGLTETEIRAGFLILRNRRRPETSGVRGRVMPGTGCRRGACFSTFFSPGSASVPEFSDMRCHFPAFGNTGAVTGSDPAAGTESGRRNAVKGRKIGGLLGMNPAALFRIFSDPGHVHKVRPVPDRKEQNRNTDQEFFPDHIQTVNFI